MKVAIIGAKNHHCFLSLQVTSKIARCGARYHYSFLGLRTLARLAIIGAARRHSVVTLCVYVSNIALSKDGVTDSIELKINDPTRTDLIKTLLDILVGLLRNLSSDSLHDLSSDLIGNLLSDLACELINDLTHHDIGDWLVWHCSYFESNS